MIYLRILGKIGRRSGGSYHVTLPLEEVERLKWRKGLWLHIHPTDDGLLIMKADYRRRIDKA